MLPSPVIGSTGRGSSSDLGLTSVRRFSGPSWTSADRPEFLFRKELVFRLPAASVSASPSSLRFWPNEASWRLVACVIKQLQLAPSEVITWSLTVVPYKLWSKLPTILPECPLTTSNVISRGAVRTMITWTTRPDLDSKDQYEQGISTSIVAGWLGKGLVG